MVACAACAVGDVGPRSQWQLLADDVRTAAAVIDPMLEEDERVKWVPAANALAEALDSFDGGDFSTVRESLVELEKLKPIVMIALGRRYDPVKANAWWEGVALVLRRVADRIG